MGNTPLPSGRRLEAGLGFGLKDFSARCSHVLTRTNHLGAKLSLVRVSEQG